MNKINCFECMKRIFFILMLSMTMCLSSNAQPFANGYVTPKYNPMYDVLGKKFYDITAKGLDKKNHKLSEYVGKGKYVLIDFWASWCRPCMNEMPNVKACYEKYKGKGFKVVGCSLDEREKDWRNAIIDNKLQWIQLCDFGGWEGAAAKRYKLEGIPFSVLCDGKGTVIAVDLRGEALQEKLYEIYGF